MDACVVGASLPFDEASSGSVVPAITIPVIGAIALCDKLLDLLTADPVTTVPLFATNLGD